MLSLIIITGSITSITTITLRTIILLCCLILEISIVSRTILGGLIVCRLVLGLIGHRITRVVHRLSSRIHLASSGVEGRVRGCLVCRIRFIKTTLTDLVVHLP